MTALITDFLFVLLAITGIAVIRTPVSPLERPRARASSPVTGWRERGSVGRRTRADGVSSSS